MTLIIAYKNSITVNQTAKVSRTGLLLKICSPLKFISHVTGIAFFSMLLTPQYFSCESITALNAASLDL